VLEFVRSNYDVDFPMFSKIEVNGDGACELYNFLKAGNPDEEGNVDIKWNFTKFLVGKDGQVLKRYGPKTTPEEIGAELSSHF
jgi:glutathione peroxidase